MKANCGYFNWEPPSRWFQQSPLSTLYSFPHEKTQRWLAVLLLWTNASCVGQTCLSPWFLFDFLTPSDGQVQSCRRQWKPLCECWVWLHLILQLAIKNLGRAARTALREFGRVSQWLAQWAASVWFWVSACSLDDLRDRRHCSNSIFSYSWKIPWCVWMCVYMHFLTNSGSVVD